MHEDPIERLRALVKDGGLVKTANALRLPPSTVHRLVHGKVKRGHHEGTLIVLRLALHDLDVELAQKAAANEAQP